MSFLCLCVLSCFSHVQLFVIPWTVACQASLSMGFSRQEYWSGCCALLQGIYLTQESNPPFLYLLHQQAGSLPLASPGKQDSTLKSRDIILLTKVHLVKAMAFPVVMYGYKSWTIKKAECQRIDAFELWCWKTLLESPLDCKKSKPVNPKEYQPWIFTGRTDAEAPILWPLSKEPTH